MFQRSPNYIIPRGDRAIYSDEERALFLQAAERSQSRDGFSTQEHEGWFDAFHPDTAPSEEFRQAARAHLDASHRRPAQLREKLWPTYPLGCKRLIISDDFLPAMARDNVTLVTERIARIEPTGIRTTDGVLHETDVIVYGTGFDTLQFLGTGDITGRDNRSLRARRGRRRRRPISA